ncbi:alpha/beta hydrolase fold containing protein [Emticicia oligotrophica DSM 17448]|uniref:Alpha/beta hydrolase fold containing protein n=1 Tax=Emticicia oligotrophica (strain DSM 17448 / CIP 109782 / MTCC 6937 / GPTSA100-15) TaxID=929562 RepID=A0ABM5MXU8_EMTOG|nr:alpha/beta hydrolase [Emticicia oligotrophica]AFK01921.1 alpha/beta hydrolase fold containing protein [Emticicia oligotrophica DSM 17448]
MKKLLLILFAISFIGKKGLAQDITGSWNGTLKVGTVQLRLVVNISKTGNAYNSTLDSPDQGAKGIAVTKTTFENAKLKFEIPVAQIEYVGDFKNDKFFGTFKQSGKEFPLELSKGGISVAAVKRPQEPQKPFPYYSEEITFENPKAQITLAGTLTLPQKEGVFPAVILISGSGPQNRDEELLGHKPFLVISDYLTRHGIAVLRFDDRGVGQSKGVFKTATSADHASDVASAVAYLKTRKEINQIGLMGHSEGGLIAPMVAANNNQVSFIVLLAGTGISGDKLLLMQQELISRANGVSEPEIALSKKINEGAFKIIVQSNDDEQLKKDLATYIGKMVNENPEINPKGVKEEDFIAQQVKSAMSPWPWMQYFLKYDPVENLKLVKCPILAVNGEKDLQVPAKENLSAIENIVKKAGNKDVTTKAYPNLNHLFQECKTGSPAEYSTIEQTFSPLVMEDFTKWIKIKTK